MLIVQTIFYRPIHTLFTGRSIFIETNYRKTKKEKKRKERNRFFEI